MMVLREREGMVVYCTEGVLVKESKDEANRLALANAIRFYRALEGTPYVPKVYSYTPGRIEREFVEATPVTDTELARRNTAHMLHTLRQKHIIHGDMTAPNFVLRDNVPVVFDWDQAIFTHEPKPQKRPKPDAYHVWPAVVTQTGDPSRVIRRWLACQPALEYYAGWGTLLDLGTHMGDFPGMASAQGFRCTGVDGEHIRPCIREAEDLWGQYGCEFVKADIVDYLRGSCPSYDIIMLFSTWPYIIQQQGLQVAEDMLARCVELSSIFLFEVQYAGDGPGPDFLSGDDDTRVYLSQFGQVDYIDAFPVVGRPHSRTLWKITSVEPK